MTKEVEATLGLFCPYRLDGRMRLTTPTENHLPAFAGVLGPTMILLVLDAQYSDKAVEFVELSNNEIISTGRLDFCHFRTKYSESIVQLAHVFPKMKIHHKSWDEISSPKSPIFFRHT